ncbi:hypothetical protein AKJ09_04644 [Labilithrix luteola]|uniref:Tryptophan synthase alpha chain n=1 Tax=Labilithrix luteola TaxID=1391654 RepID=A0A0K1PWR9_9BACT|nr:hypothetical protein [Labilithrix luteola]AKU97980.1 hypothetical protein AKJ09_04644 [Labilithrix luteola]
MRFFASADSFSKSLIVAAAIGGALLVGAPACSSSDNNNPTGPAPCDSSKCAAGNTCLTYGGETKCRKTCSSNSDASSSCPFNYTCVAGEDGGQAFCRKDTSTNGAGAALTSGAGQWGTTCTPSGGIAENPDCDSAQGFVCNGASKTDGDAYCTKFDCTQDSDCAAGFYCGTINATPNVETDERTVGETVRACVRREYCAPCNTDLECSSGQHCVADADGAGFCTPECSDNKNCNNEAVCADVGIGPKVCFPRAQRCVGDGSFCSPCRSDADCGADGACVKGQYTTERACAKKSQVACSIAPVDSTGKPTADAKAVSQCPTAPADMPNKIGVGCYGAKKEKSSGLAIPYGIAGIPADYCTGFYPFGQGSDIGCWSWPVKAK